MSPQRRRLEQGVLRSCAAIVGLVAISLVMSAAATMRAQGVAADDEAAKRERLKWFHEAKYGLFIHWGLYAVPAGEWKGQRIPGIGEWIMNRAKIPVREYEQIARQFNPVKFNADEWVQLARDAGMKYIVITSKHHDGFALFDSKVSKYDVVDATPFKRDILKELVAACRKQNMPLGFYYSQSQDWHEPNGAGNNWDFGPDDKKDYDKYLREKAEPQVKELLTEYGPVALVWFDTPRMMEGDRAKRFTRIVRELSPKTLIDGRLGEPGDYMSTGDNVVPPAVQTTAWEVPATINHTWGYKAYDHDWKSPGNIIFKLVDIVSKGGNYLLNVGPMANGVIPEPSQYVLRAAGYVAEDEWGSGLRRRADSLGRRAWRTERQRSEGSSRPAADARPHRVARHDETRKAVFHLFCRTARSVRAAGDEERGQEGLSPRRRRCGGLQG